MSQIPHKEDQDKPNLSWSLNQWLEYLLSIHTQSIDMGLERTKGVFDTLKIHFGQAKVVLVAGTNGKGTTCRVVEKGLLQNNKTVAVYSSPHITDFKERLRINDNLLSDEQFISAFMQVEKARGDTPLTYFEFTTLAAMYLMMNNQTDFVLLEVGLGGRLDAVNVVNPDMAVITSIGLDHQDWLGDTRDQIAIEKAGVFRPHLPVIIGEQDPPQSLINEVDRLAAQATWQGRDFTFQADQNSWHWHNTNCDFDELVTPMIPMQNVSTGLEVLHRLGIDLNQHKVNQLIQQTSLPGRFERVLSQPEVILDVAHNPQATSHLKERINQCQFKQLRLVLAMLADKDISASIAPLEALNATWYLASLTVPRGASSKKLKSLFNDDQKVIDFETVSDALNRAIKEADPQDLIVVFGSFFTVCQAKEALTHLR
ncbi:bifunctional tetrahydrofolate synthase/dihydrofolate synthase [Aliiglaciecola litoralis]|uniref:Dihydrofolate synthase/folylpolyglutamate synthase n=1 Tax=Aliiglaciecola litoralis TaxID=582857 RepID=A0ABN1LNU2_9ALTE